MTTFRFFYFSSVRTNIDTRYTRAGQLHNGWDKQNVLKQYRKFFFTYLQLFISLNFVRLVLHHHNLLFLHDFLCYHNNNIIIVRFLIYCMYSIKILFHSLEDFWFFWNVFKLVRFCVTFRKGFSIFDTYSLTFLLHSHLNFFSFLDIYPSTFNEHRISFISSHSSHANLLLWVNIYRDYLDSRYITYSSLE